MRLLGLSGTNGSGKDTVGHFLADQYGFLFISVSDLLRDECRTRNLPITRENLRTISAEWRRKFGLGVLVDKCVEAYRAADGDYIGVIASPMRNSGEAKHLKDLGGILIWVDADPQIRYQRVISTNRGRADEDNKTYEQFQAEERAEMYQSGDTATLNMAAVREMADVQLLNETDVTKLQSDVITALGLSPV